MRKSLKNKKILVVGDTILDKDHIIEVTGLSLESPTIKGNLKDTNVKLGGAANVVKYLHEFGCDVTFVTSIRSKELVESICSKLINVYNEHDNVKNRYWIQKGDALYKYLQVNDCNDKGLELSTKLFLDNEYDLVIVSDYRCGLVSNSILESVNKINCKKIATSQKSDKNSNYFKYKNFDILIVNQNEYKSFLEEKLDHTISKIIVTKGDSGAEEILSTGIIHYKSYPVNQVNVIGAGDAFCAAYSATESIDFANKWASYVVSKNIFDKISMKDFLLHETKIN